MPHNILDINTLNVQRFQSLTDPVSIQRGRSYYQQRRARLQSVNKDSADVFVQGSQRVPYHVRFEVSEGVAHAACNCPIGGGEVDLVCKHIIAAAMTLRDYLHANPRVTWDSLLSQVLDAGPQRVPPTGRLMLLFSLQKRDSDWGVYAYSLPASAFPDPLADAASLLKIIKRDRLRTQAKPVRSKTDAYHYANITEKYQGALNLLAMSQEYSYSYYYTISPKIFLSQLKGDALFQGSENSPFQSVVRVAEDPLVPTLELQETPSGLQLRTLLRQQDTTVSLTDPELVRVNRDPLWLLANGVAYEVEGVSSAFASLSQNPELEIPMEERELFLERYLLPLASQFPISGEALQWERAGGEPQPRLYLSEQDGQLLAALTFAYGEHEVLYEKAREESLVLAGTDPLTVLRLTRQPLQEDQVRQRVTDFGLKRGAEPQQFTLRANVTPVDFLLHQVPRLTEAGFTIYGEEALTSARINRNTPKLSWRVSSGIDWFDLDALVSFGDQDVALKEIRKAVRKKERFVKLADGSIGAIPPEWLERYRYLFALSSDSEEGEGLRLSGSQIGLLDQLLEEGDALQADTQFQERRARLRAFQKIRPQKLPKGLQGELRPYQKAGVDWLHFLHDYEFGGCLADDMGLGKTIITLTFLQSLLENKAAATATLLVLPRSLISNWEREAAKFTPQLRLLNHAHGTRAKDLTEFDRYDLILTTYGVMLRDIELLRQHRFHYVILDEAQAIKNPLSQSGKAARLLQSDHRLTLTGTPVENSTLELWSQFAFLNPGLLGSLETFRTEFAAPIEKGHDEAAAGMLRQLVKPFILRRTKDQVARDLPPRTERIIYTEMEPGQRRLYNAKRDEYRAQILGLLDESGMNNARMKILEGLLRLRQISNHPRLVDSATKSGSAKFDALLETLDTLQAEGHKALIFSQFVQMLIILREELDARKIPYAYLDGKTHDRQGKVDQFQNDPAIPFFLISLRAGGVGLNLTAADYVIHIDPWWNPAVEMQATDRTHRIGQDKPVFVDKLIARDSVEEKILELQERKRSLVNRLVGSEAGLFKSLTRQDIEALFR